MEWDSKIDIWAVAVMIWDLFEGGRLFRAVKDGHLNDEQHLAEMVSLLGPPPKKFLERSVLEAVRIPPVITAEMFPLIREASAHTTAEEALAGRDLSLEEKTIPVENGEIQLAIFRPKPSPASTAPAKSPCIYYIHGGGMITGNQFFGLGHPLDWTQQYGAVCVSVGYRLAPEHPDPAPVEDCYAGLLWLRDHYAALGIDAARVMVAGQSAGGGLAAGVALLARDRGGPSLAAQCLMCPMLDDRGGTVSNRQFEVGGSWGQKSNVVGWTALLGSRRGQADVSIYAAPARARDLSGLPSTFIDVASAETFRDEDVAYASKLWECGVQAELHVWPGGFHGSDMVAPTAAISQVAIRTRSDWVRRTLLTK
ncbi:hypothetical protein MBLNU459_g2378t2 [Dothideomycetes sp. NU459]